MRPKKSPQERVARLQREAEEDRLRQAEEARKREEENARKAAEDEKKRVALLSRRFLVRSQLM